MSKEKELLVAEDELSLGSDVGNGYTKNRKVKFASKVVPGEKTHLVGRKKKDIYEVKYDNVSYIVGEGSAFTGEQRYFSLEYKLCLLTSIALAFPKQDFIEGAFCVGLPLELHEKYSEKLIEEFKGKQFEIEVEGKLRTIRIKDFDVFVEAAYPILTKDQGRVVTIDMGAGTVNVTQFFEGGVEKYATYDESMYKMYADIAQYLNTKKGSRFMPRDIEPILNKKAIEINQEVVDITDIKPIIEANIRAIVTEINNKFDIAETGKIYLIGGGSMDTAKYWKKFYPKATPVEDAQSVNYRVYDLVAAGLAEDDEA